MLSQKSCKPCNGKTAPLPLEKSTELLKNLHGWTLSDRQINRDFSFKDFAEALAFVNRVGEIAEQEGHHPDIFLHQYKQVRVTLWTHVVSGLTENDFILAAKIDALL